MSDYENLAICPFCGQVFTSDNQYATKEESNEAGAMRCKCADAVKFQQRKRAATEGKANLNNLIEHFEKSYNVEKIENNLIEYLENGIDLVVDKKIKNITVKLGFIGSISISLNADFEIVIKRAVTFKEQM